MLVNNERILYVERTENECVVYTVMFDSGHTLELDEQTGKMFTEQLGRLQRPESSVEYIHTERPYLPPRIPRRRRAVMQLRG
jgi:hypothetical protein